ncbi:hypothetical protein JOB18_043763 [Solea senegalensis]|uniref:Uncharacterized protein n=1 Tax=Solea senegalensis TaxID=28829 RepID=A0AAV6S0F8_SOLSE|nr:hypothetical protein JOB18_043763 [Solea senegalensis]
MRVHRVKGNYTGFQPSWKTALNCKLCASTIDSPPHSPSAGLDAQMGSWDKSWKGCKRAVVVCYSALWVGACYGVHSNPEAAPQLWDKEARPRGPRLSGPTAPVG